MEEANISMMCAVCEAYLAETKGVKVKIVFDNPQRARIQFVRLSEMYSIAVAYYNNKK
jgi:hypothetical protein